MTKPVIVVCILGVVIGFLGGGAVNNDGCTHQDKTRVVIHHQLVPPHENLPSLVRAVEVVAIGEVVSTQSFLTESGSPYSVHQFRVERWLKGDIEQTPETDVIRLIQATGPVPANVAVEDLELMDSLLEEGERYVVFPVQGWTVSERTPEVHPGDYGLPAQDGAIHLRDGQARPLRDWTPIAQMLKTQQMSEEELIDLVSQAEAEAAPGTEQ